MSFLGFNLVSDKTIDNWLELTKQAKQIIDSKDYELEEQKRELEFYRAKIIYLDGQLKDCIRDMVIVNRLADASYCNLLDDVDDMLEKDDVELGLRNVIITNLQNELVDQEELIRQEMVLNLEEQE